MISALIPQVLVESGDFTSLHVEQQEQFTKRLLFVQGVLQEAASWLASPEGEFYEFADGLELDLTSAMYVDIRDTEKQVSTWFMHSTWTFDARARSLSELISTQVYMRLDDGLPNFSSSQSEIQDWFKSEMNVAVAVFDDLSGAKSFDQAIACLIAVDTFLGRLLVVLSKWRLWLPH